MLIKQFKRMFLSPFNFLIPLVIFAAWYKGIEASLSNLEFLKAAYSYPDGPAKELFILQAENFSGFTVFAEGICGFFVVAVAAVLAGLAFSSGFAYDKNTGFGNFLITRSGFNKYFISTVFSVFSAPFITAFISLTIPLIYSIAKYSDSSPKYTYGWIMSEGAMFTNLFINKPWLSSFFMIFIVSLVAGMFALLGMGASAFTNNRFVISVVPVAYFILCTLIPQLFPANTPIAKVLAWIYPSYLTGIFLGDTWYSKLSQPITLAVHLIVLAIPITALLVLLYSKNKRQYIK